MKKHFYTLLFCLPLGMVNAQTKTSAVLSLPSDTYDFDTLYQGDRCFHEFVFTNTGNEPLIITQAHTSCGCDMGSHQTEPVKPGGQGKFSYLYDSKRLGPINKTMTVTGNFEGSPRVIRIKGYIVPRPEKTGTPKPVTN